MPLPTAPYTPFKYLVILQSPLGEKPLGGFSELVAPTTETHGGMYKVNDITLKRGVVNSSDLWNWISEARSTSATAHRDATITLRDEANNPIQVFRLSNARPIKYVGPALNAKGSDVAIEELVLAPEGLVINPRS